MAIQVDTISENRYAPQGSEAVKLYSNGLEGGAGLTLGQLSIAISLRTAAVCEAQSVLKMNLMSNESQNLETISRYVEDLANDAMSYWAEARSFLISELKIAGESLPDAIDTFTKRLEAINAIKVKIDQLTQTQQTSMIDLQTLINRRDTAYSTSSNMVRALGTSMNKSAVNFI